MRERLRWLAFLGVLGLGGLLVLAVLTVQLTSTPSFCGSCHIMRPYYASWKASTHNHIACVECHIPPGLGSEVQKKYEALSMVARYFTGTYSTKPWAEVEDAACFRCHEKRLLTGPIRFQEVKFNHAPHLSELRNGKRLRCTSCHTQIVQDTHIEVSTAPCFLCHFKGSPPGQGVARCTLCHEVPDTVVTASGMRFVHQRVRTYSISCTWCHTGNVQGTGTVARERCLSCHNRRDILENFPNTPRLHQIHITEHKVECGRCHEEIQHGRNHLTPRVSACQQCHTSGHSPVRDLYAGRGGTGVPPRPDPMFRVGTGCNGCHFLPDSTRSGPLRRAGAASCMACHGPAFQKVYQSWKRALQHALKRTEDAIARARPFKQRIPGWDAIVGNLRLIKQGNGIHNVGYSLALLQWSYEKIRASRVIPLAPWPEDASMQSGCSLCHVGIVSQTGRFKNLVFRHGPHLKQSKGDCRVCHRSHDEKPRGEVLRPDRNCVNCHHTRSLRSNCQRCHLQIPETLKVAGKRFPHAYHVGEDVELECTDCHTESGWKAPVDVCAECHDD